jgi:hypothetical protein
MKFEDHPNGWADAKTMYSATEGWAEQETLTKSCQCIQHARAHLSNAQNLNEIGMEGHAFFTLGCALNSLVNHVDGRHDPL